MDQKHVPFKWWDFHGNDESQSLKLEQLAVSFLGRGKPTPNSRRFLLFTISPIIMEVENYSNLPWKKANICWRGPFSTSMIMEEG